MADYRKEGESSLQGVRQKIAERLKNDDTKVQVGYSAEPAPKRKEGDTWQDGYKTWTVKNGITQTISKLQSARTPLWCPKCSNIMIKRLDNKMYPIHGMCFDCVITMEHKLRLDGKWEEYEARKLRENEISYLKYTIEKFKCAYDEVNNPEFIYEDGQIEKWHANVGAVKKEIQEDINRLQTRLDNLELSDASIAAN